SLGLVDEEDNDVTDDVSGGGKKWHVTPCQGGNARRKQEWISSQHMVSI
ncbi:hypothetical protein Tco_0927480, partial [Tanacetum coccineum]